MPPRNTLRRALVHACAAATLGLAAPTFASAQAGGSAPAAPAPTPAARPADVASLEAITVALYDVISGPAGQKRDWDRFRSLFAPGARLIVARTLPTGGAQAMVMTPEDYITRAGARLERDGFFESELAQKTEAFGNIAHRFSTYESRHTAADPKPFARGINSIQLLKDGGRWWVVSIFWDSERPGLEIPAQYLR